MNENLKTCGVVMPISSIDGCDSDHWEEVFAILSEAISEAGYKANLVSNADEVGVIHKRIIQNLYENPIVVCDISGKNPNVMFELGMRLAFDKPTILVKDDITDYSFDTSAIEHIEYPRSLRFKKIKDFKTQLQSKIRATVDRFETDADHTTFLKHFGEFKVVNINKREIPEAEFILDELKQLRIAVQGLDNNYLHSSSDSSDTHWYARDREEVIDLCLEALSTMYIEKLLYHIARHDGVKRVSVKMVDMGHTHVQAYLQRRASRKEVKQDLGAKVREIVKLQKADLAATEG